MKFDRDNPETVTFVYSIEKSLFVTYIVFIQDGPFISVKSFLLKNNTPNDFFD